MLQVQPIPAFKDNYIWLIQQPESKTAIVVDPGDANPVLEFLEQKNITLSAILLTHHHNDHIGGVDALCEKYSVPIYGPAKDNIAQITHPLYDQEEIYFSDLDLKLQALEIPGHTLGHMAFCGNNFLFCGDTLFTGGCGRLFEGTAQQLFDSLQKLSALPDETAVYCGHEYTQANLRFADIVDPDNAILKKRITETLQQREKNQPTVPSNIGLEKATNPFLRCHSKTIHENVEKHWQMKLTTPAQVFEYLRRWKDTF